jgi:opacity protein-like surface antigen
MRWILVVSIGVLSLGGVASAGRAEETGEPRWYFGARIGTGFMLHHQVAPDIDVSSWAPVSGVFAGVHLNRYLGVEMAADLFEVELRVPGRRAVGEYGMFSLIPQVRARYPLLEGRLTPYVIGGIGVGHNEFNDRKPRGLGLKVDAEGTALVGAVGGGIEYSLANTIAVGVEAKLLLSRDQEIKVQGRGGRANLDALFTAAHLRLLFPDGAAPVSSRLASWWRPYIGLRTGGAILIHTEAPADLEIRPENAAIGGKVNQLVNVALGVDLGQYAGIELSVDSYETNLTVRPFGAVREYAIYAAIPQLRLRYPLAAGRLAPYLLAGVGLSYAETNDGKPPGFDLPMTKVDYSVAAAAGGGIDYFLATNIAFGLETKYLSSRDHRLSMPGRSSHVSLDALLISFGTRIFLR